MPAAVAVTGASGFLGRHFLARLLREPGVAVRALVHSAASADLPFAPGLAWIRGELDDPQALAQLIFPGSRVVNLAYPAEWALDRHLAAAAALGQAAIRLGATRFVHCSTAVVAGNIPASRVDESTACRPSPGYEQTKLGIEAALACAVAGAVPLAILRPTAILGPGGQNLLKVAQELTSGSRILSYLRACLYGRRRMNLVCVENVCEALMFLLSREQAVASETFLVSDDDDPHNNFRDVQSYLMRQLGVQGFAVPVLPLPQVVLAAVLKVAGRSLTDPTRVYDASALSRAGFRSVASLTDALDRFASWFRNGAVRHFG